VSDKYAFIAAEQASDQPVLPVTSKCTALQVSRSGFYDWAKATPSPRTLRRTMITEYVTAAFARGRGTYGARRVHAVLARSDDPQVGTVSLDLVRTIMVEQGLRACQPRAYRVTTVSDEATRPGIVDHLGRDFTASAPGTTLVGDITYIRTWAGWLYLATVIDCHNKTVIGWSMATPHAHRADLRRHHHGRHQRRLATRCRLSFRPRHPIYKRPVRRAPALVWNYRIHGTHRRVLGQRHGRILLRRVEE